MTIAISSATPFDMPTGTYIGPTAPIASLALHILCRYGPLHYWGLVPDDVLVVKPLMATEELVDTMQKRVHEAEAQVISGFYEERVPQFRQGAPRHELEEVVTAADVTNWVARIEELEAAAKAHATHAVGRCETLHGIETTGIVEDGFAVYTLGGGDVGCDAHNITGCTMCYGGEGS